ncbi:hypothetical protein RJ640_017716 [Escallonia rubra]|uniref:RING-type domain-containing protein n=1 Tax=Escallonia rubra TaxID=112253 RepID=A0AA88R8J2_9ASTE|nr:hypothetical protein RJ640_017716 [Escallonia rubra]
MNFSVVRGNGHKFWIAFSMENAAEVNSSTPMLGSRLLNHIVAGIGRLGLGQALQNEPTKSSKGSAERHEIQRPSAPTDPGSPISRHGPQETSLSDNPAQADEGRVMQKTSGSNDPAPSISGIKPTEASKDPARSISGSILSEVFTDPAPSISGTKPTEASKAPARSISGTIPSEAFTDPAPSTSRTKPSQAYKDPAQISTKTRPSISGTRPTSSHAVPKHLITWDGFDEEREPVDQNCPICDKDLSAGPNPLSYESEYEEDYAPFRLTVVSILPCGHTFHSECLELALPEEQSNDPPCFLCFSCMV